MTYILNTRSIFGGLAMGAVLLTGTVARAHGGHSHEEEDDKSGAIGYEKAAMIDSEIIAERSGYSTSIALRFAENARHFADFSYRVSERYSDVFASATYAEEPGDRAVLRFKGEVPADIRKEIARFEYPVEAVGGARYTALELQQYAARVHETLLEAGWTQVVTSATDSDSVETTVYAKAEAKLPRLPGNVKVAVSFEPIAEDHHSRGGGNILNSGNARICTSGFSVTKGGVHGISTSGHCTTMDKYQEPDTLTIYESDDEDSHYGFWGDYQWQSTPTHIDPAEYFARTNEIRDVNTVSNWLPVNTPTCSFGRTTLVRNCDEVYSNFVVATFNGPTHWFLMANDNNFSQPGDSGGPISWSTEADGLNKGSMTLGGSRRQVWVRASLMPIAIGASVRTK